MIANQTSPISFSHVTFGYDGSVTQNDGENVFSDFSIDIPIGTTSLIGQNGTGKSTLLLLAGARLYPQFGTITVLGRDTKTLIDQEEKNQYISFVYQNMEFESDEPIGALFEYVYENGFHKKHDPDFIPQLIKSFELENVTGKKTQNVSKGELQRAILVFSLLYGSYIIMMDEPIFAMEHHQKEKAMDFLYEYAQAHAIPLLFSVHELELTQKYSDFTMLFYNDHSVELGQTKEICDRDRIEKAYEVPYGMLYKKEQIHRQRLMQMSTIMETGEQSE